jgi:glycerol-3-phosphate acyltransferase PlsY
MRILFPVLSVILAYLLGSLPIGVFAARLIKGVEVRKIGSGRTGTTNVYRAAGPWGVIVTSIGDVFKGVLAIWIARALTGSAWVEAVAGIAAVGGHNWSIFLGFKGGAGTVTTLGALAAMNPYIAIALIVPAIIVLIVTRMASTASITIALAMGPALAISAALGFTHWAYLLFGVISGGFTIYALAPNIKRILSGEERRLKTNY